VHFPNELPSQDATLSYFGTSDDDSNSGSGRYYKTSNNLPWAISIPNAWDNPYERKSIDLGYLDFITWAESGGSTNTDWYLTNKETTKLYMISPSSNAEEFAFIDTNGDDVAAEDFSDFLQGLSPDSSWYIFFEIESTFSGKVSAWCSERADWYRSEYLNRVSEGSSVVSGDWSKWHRQDLDESWVSDNGTYLNRYGISCDGNAFSWCSEWGIGGNILAILPKRSDHTESYSGNQGGFQTGSLKVRISATRNGACGF